MIPTIQILCGDALEQLRTLPDESVNCCVTSPPYWGLRDYNVAGQIGLEKTLSDYVANLVAVFSEVRRVLCKDGTLWMNLGDAYNAAGCDSHGTRVGYKQQTNRASANGADRNRPTDETLKPKDLIGIPWVVAFALRADGWYLRQDIIWAKPNPMPESVTDRCTKSHEYIFLLSKSARYFYDAEAISEQSITGDPRRPYTSEGAWQLDGRPIKQRHGGKPRKLKVPGGWDTGSGSHGTIHRNGRTEAQYVEAEAITSRNKRSVWTIPTNPCPEAHFATFPPDLVKPCILAGCPTSGKRCDCNELILTPTGEGEIIDPTMQTGRAGMNRPRRNGEGKRPITKHEQRGHAEQMKQSPHRSKMQTICGEAFAHYIRTDSTGARPLPPEILSDFKRLGWIVEVPECMCPIEPPGVVLDPFAGSGTTGQVALELGRSAVLIELNAEYVAMIRQRCNVTPGLPI